MIENIVVSPKVMFELFDSIDRGVNTGLVMKLMVQEIIDRAHIFINRFSDSYFLESEPIHDFIGIEFRNPETSKLEQEVHYRLVIRKDDAGVYSPSEIPIDDMYDIRHLIAESQLPEFYEDKLPSQDS